MLTSGQSCMTAICTAKSAANQSENRDEIVQDTFFLPRGKLPKLPKGRPRHWRLTACVLRGELCIPDYVHRSGRRASCGFPKPVNNTTCNAVCRCFQWHYRQLLQVGGPHSEYLRTSMFTCFVMRGRSTSLSWHYLGAPPDLGSHFQGGTARMCRLLMIPCQVS